MHPVGSYCTDISRCGSTKHYILCSIAVFFENRAVYEIMWENVVEWGRPQLIVCCMLIACWLQIHTHTDCVIHIVVCFLLGNSPAAECCMPTFRNTLFHLHKPMKMEKSVPKRRHIKFRRRGIIQKKAYSIQNTAKV